MAAIPPALIRWFQSAYPSVTFDDEWLGACVDYIQTEFGATGQALIKQVETQLLASDLSTSTLQNDKMLPTAYNMTSAKPSVLFPAKSLAVLVQILSIDEIGHAALGLLETLKEKRERRLQTGEVEEEEAAENEVPEEEEALQEKQRTWPRGMVKLQVSDGHTTLTAIEMERIPGLGLGQFKLGAKLLLQNVKMVRGVLFLTPASVTLKGSHVMELEQNAEAALEQTLRARLGLAAAPPPAPRRAHIPPAAQQVRREAFRQPRQDPLDEFDEKQDFDDDFDALVAAEEQALAAVRSAVPNRGNANRRAIIQVDESEDEKPFKRPNGQTENSQVIFLD